MHQHPGGHQGALAEERGDEPVGRHPVEVARRADLLQPAIPQDGDPVGQGQGLFLVVRDVHDGRLRLAMDAAELLLHLDAEGAVQRPQGLVHEEETRMEGQGPSHGHPLLLAAR